MTPLTLRPATHADQLALERLAALDSSRPLEGEVLLAAAGDEVQAALSLASGRVVADPFRPTADLVALLRTAAAGERRPQRARRRLARPALA
jgi:hypothetical protein